MWSAKVELESARPFGPLWLESQRNSGCTSYSFKLSGCSMTTRMAARQCSGVSENDWFKPSSSWARICLLRRNSQGKAESELHYLKSRASEDNESDDGPSLNCQSTLQIARIGSELRNVVQSLGNIYSQITGQTLAEGSIFSEPDNGDPEERRPDPPKPVDNGQVSETDSEKVERPTFFLARFHQWGLGSSKRKRAHHMGDQISSPTRNHGSAPTTTGHHRLSRRWSQSHSGDSSGTIPEYYYFYYSVPEAVVERKVGIYVPISEDLAELIPAPIPAMSVPYAFEAFKQNSEGMVRVRHVVHQLVTEQFDRKKKSLKGKQKKIAEAYIRKFQVDDDFPEDFWLDEQAEVFVSRARTNGSARLKFKSKIDFLSTIYYLILHFNNFLLFLISYKIYSVHSLKTVIRRILFDTRLRVYKKFHYSHNIYHFHNLSVTLSLISLTNCIEYLTI